MTAAPHRHSIAIWMLLIIGSIVALIIAIMAVNAVRFDNSASIAANTSNRATLGRTSAPLGTSITIRAAGIEVQRALPMAAFAIGPDESLDRRIPPGPFECEMTVTFLRGGVREARLGAEIQNGSVIIQPAGRTSTAEDAAGDESRTVLGRDLLSFTRAPQQVTYIFKSNGAGAARLRALWQPIDLDIPLPLPSSGAPLLLSDDALAGMALVQQLNCAACHHSADALLQAQLHVSPGPILGDVGRRVRPQWLHQWLEDPAATKPGTPMPRIPHATSQEIDDITHFLASMGGPIDVDEQADADLVPTGMIAYHTVGCFACHGPLEPIENLPGDRRAVAVPIKAYESLGNVSAKTTPAHLAEFLLDPLKSRPSARMPPQNLSALEAQAIAAYLFSREQKNQPQQRSAATEFTIDPSKVDRGRVHFASLGCANCHELGPDRPPIATTLSAPQLESLSSSEPRACLAPPVAESTIHNFPHFTLTDRDRRRILAFLQSLPQRRCNNVPIDRVLAGMSRLNCVACHRFHGERGPERAIAQYFTTVAEADLGDEGRLPPDLSDAGAKLNPLWMHEVIANGEVARPYMGARMPAFGEHVGRELSHAFAAISGVPAKPDDGPTTPIEYASIGRDLVGSKGMACIQCHTIAGHDATGTPGPDLAQAPQRLRYDNFARWVQAPAHIRPGTRMPSFFSSGVSGLTQYLDGEAARQIPAMWAYLSQGEFLLLPEGLTDAAGLEMIVGDEPLVFRTFLQPAGFRAIAVGFPEQIHCAFDAQNCRLAAIWTGAFLNAKGAWANRGGSETNPTRLEWSAPQPPDGESPEPVIRFLASDHGESSSSNPTLRFRGYRLDDQRRPIFIYDASSGGVTVNVEEQPVPVRNREARAGGSVGGGPVMLRRFTLQGPPGISLSILGESIQLNADGRAEYEIEMTW